MDVESLVAMKKLLLFLLVASLMIGCSPEKKLNRLLMKYPELSRKDTIRDTVWATVEYVHTDTLFESELHDTVYIDTGRLHIKYVRLPGKVSYIDGKCDPDSIPVPYEVIVERVAPKEYIDRIPWWIWIIIALSISIAFVAVLKR